MTPEQALMSTSQVADALQVDVRTVTRWAKLGKLPSVVLPSGRRKYRRADVDALLANADASERVEASA